MDDCKRREETGAKPLRRVSSTGLRHGSPESKVSPKPGVSKDWARWGPGDTGHTESSAARNLERSCQGPGNCHVTTVELKDIS